MTPPVSALGSLRQSTALHLLNHDFVHDRRVERAAAVTLQLGYRAVVLCYNRSTLAEREFRDGIEIQRVPYGRGGVLIRLSGHLYRFVNAASAAIRFIWRGIRLKPSIVHANDVLALPTGWVIARLTGARLIYDSHELWSDESRFYGMPWYYRTWTQKLERFFAHRADVVVTVSCGIARLMRERLVLRTTPYVVRNIPDVVQSETKSLPENSFREKLGLTAEKRIFLYQGLLGRSRALIEIVQAMRLVRNPAVVLVILGQGELRDELRLLIRELDLGRRVFLYGAVPHDDLPQYTREAELGSCLLEAISSHYIYAMPNKLFEYIASGVPVLVGATPDIADIVRKYNAGIVIDSLEPREIARALDSFFGNQDVMNSKTRGATMARTALTWAEEKKVLVKVYGSGD